MSFFPIRSYYLQLLECLRIVYFPQFQKQNNLIEKSIIIINGIINHLLEYHKLKTLLSTTIIYFTIKILSMSTLCLLSMRQTTTFLVLTQFSQAQIRLFMSFRLKNSLVFSIESSFEQQRITLQFLSWGSLRFSTRRSPKCLHSSSTRNFSRFQMSALAFRFDLFVSFFFRCSYLLAQKLTLLRKTRTTLSLFKFLTRQIDRMTTSKMLFSRFFSVDRSLYTLLSSFLRTISLLSFRVRLNSVLVPVVVANFVRESRSVGLMSFSQICISLSRLYSSCSSYSSFNWLLLQSVTIINYLYRPRASGECLLYTYDSISFGTYP